VKVVLPPSGQSQKIAVFTVHMALSLALQFRKVRTVNARACRSGTPPPLNIAAEGPNNGIVADKDHGYLSSSDLFSITSTPSKARTIIA